MLFKDTNLFSIGDNIRIIRRAHLSNQILLLFIGEAYLCLKSNKNEIHLRVIDE